MRYDHLQQTSFTLDPARLTGLLRPYSVCSFPDIWRSAYADLLHPGATYSDRGVPMRDITTAFAAFLPDILVHGARTGTEMWLGTRNKPDNEILKALIDSGITTATHNWARKYPHKGVQLQLLPDLLQKIDPDAHLEWHPVDAIPLDGTAYSAETFRLLPDLIAEHLVTTKFTVDHGGVRKSTFQRITTPSGAELVSWPPHIHPLRTKRRWPWSYVIRLSVQTRPGDPSPYLFAHIGVRRYASPKVILKNNDRAISVALGAPAAWYDNAAPALLARASVKWRPGAKGAKQGFMDWTDDIADVLARLHGRATFPSPKELCADPLTFLPQTPPRPDGIEGAVFYRTGYRYKHPVGDGVSAKDRWRIFTALANHLKEHLTPEDQLSRVSGVSTLSRPAAKPDGIRIDTAPIAAAIGPKITVEIWWQTKTILDETLLAVPRVLNLPALNLQPGADTWQTGDEHIQVTIRAIPFEHPSRLTPDTTIKRKRDRIRDASAHRVADLKDWLKSRPADGPTFVIVELDNADSFTDEDDPKFPTRIGAAHTGRHTQFLVPPQPKESDKNRRTRVEQSLRDLLARQTGVAARTALLGLDHDQLPPETRVAGIWLIRKNMPNDSAYPVAVCCDPSQPMVKMRLPGTSQWVPIHEGLLKLARLDGDRAQLKPQQIAEFFDDVLTQLDELPGPTMLLTHAQNLRSKVRTLTNTELQLDSFATVIGEPVNPERHPSVRHARLRTSVNSETAQYFCYLAETVAGANGTEITKHHTGIGVGLWEGNSPHGRTFYSIPDKPPTSAKSSPRGSRIEQRQKKTKDGEIVDRLDIGSDVTNPQMLEIFLAVTQPGDQYPNWAVIPHQYRYVATHFDDPTLLPAPLHHAFKAGEYLLPGAQLDNQLT